MTDTLSVTWREVKNYLIIVVSMVSYLFLTTDVAQVLAMWELDEEVAAAIPNNLSVGA